MIQDSIKNCRLEDKNLVKYGANRDRAIVKALEEHGALTTGQIAALFFRTKTGLRKAQERLKRLETKKQIYSFRLSHDTDKIWHVDKLPKQLQHLIGLNWAYIWHRSRLISGQSIYYWKRQIDYGVLIPDGLLGIRVPGGFKWYFVEFDRSNASHNDFNKIQLYNEFYDIHETMSLWWRAKAEEFPRIEIITESERRKELIEEQIQDPKINTNGLRFDVKILNDIVRECKA